MTNHKLQNSEERPTSAKRKRVLAAVAQQNVTSEDDDNVADGIDVCDIIENYTTQHRQTATSSALHALGETIRNTLLEINEIREQNRERRHKELLQILTKMVQQESPIKHNISQTVNATSLRHEIPPSKPVHKHIAQPNITEVKEHGPIEHLNVHCFSPITFETNSSPTQLNNQTPLAEKMPPKYIKILPKPQIVTNSSNSESSSSSSMQQVTKIKGVTIVAKKVNSTKEELEKMRAQMLKLQRKKMEDRERKKQELLQMQNI